MIKVYLEWNVMTQMKNGKHKELYEILKNRERFLVPFSTSHIGDILASFKDTPEQKKWIEDDLHFISALTENLCLFNDGKRVIIAHYSPQELFYTQLEEKDLFSDISLNGLAKAFSSVDPDGSFGAILQQQISALGIDEQFKKAFENPLIADQMNSIFPGLKDNPTLAGFFDSFNKLNKELNEGEGYKHLREIVQSGLGINRDQIINSKDPHHIIDKKYEPLGASLQNRDNSKNEPKWFNELSNEYLKFDMHGYQEDKVSIQKGRKETFRNTTEDAFHAAFASCCHFFITNDRKSYWKTKKTYEKLKINTWVMRPDEFLEYYIKYLKITDPWANLALPIQIIKHGKYEESQYDSSIFRAYFVPYFSFDYFNKLLILFTNNNKEATILLTQYQPSHNFTLNSEVKQLQKKLTYLLGSDIQNLGEITDEELADEKWNGRTWNFNHSIFKLIRVNGYIQLYLDNDFGKNNFIRIFRKILSNLLQRLMRLIKRSKK
jgi:hypothetical protein